MRAIREDFNTSVFRQPVDPEGERLLSKLLAWAALILGLLFLATGCGTIKRAVGQPFVRTTNVTERVVVTPETVTYQTNGNAVAVTVVPASAVTNWTTNILVTVNPAVGRTLETVQTVNAFNPTPAKPFVDIGVYALTGLLGLIAAWKTRKANREAQAHKETSGVMEAIVTGIEVIQDPVARGAAKESVTKITDAWGMRDVAKRKIDAITP